MGEFQLMLQPLTKDELLVEAGGWQELVQAKATEIARIEVEVKRLNAKVTEGEEAQAGLQNAISESESARRQVEAATVSEAETALENARSALAEAEDLAATAAITDETTDERAALIERAGALREERVLLTDRLEAVLGQLETKTAEADTETLNAITDYRLYISAVSGLQVDVEDTVSAWLAVQGWLTSEEGGLRWAKNIAIAAGILLVAWILSKILSAAAHRGIRATGKASTLLENFVAGAVRWIIMIIGVLTALVALEVSIGPMLAVVGAAGFVIAFALQDSLSNVASGLMILFFKPFDEGDVVSAGGVTGKVEALNLVSTSIRTFDNQQMVVPNNKIWHDVITNVSGIDRRRVDTEFGIGYADDADKAQAILEDIVKSHPKVLDDPAPMVKMHTLSDSSVNFICWPWVELPNYGDVRWDIIRTVKKRFDEAGISIPFPQRDVHVYIKESPAQQGLETLSGPKAAAAGAGE